MRPQPRHLIVISNWLDDPVLYPRNHRRDGVIRLMMTSMKNALTQLTLLAALIFVRQARTSLYDMHRTSAGLVDPGRVGKLLLLRQKQ